MSLHTDPMWSAVPYPAVLISPTDEVLSCNGAAENAFSMSFRQMTGRTLSEFVGEDSPIMESIAQTRAGVASVVQYNVEVGWSDRPARPYTLHAAQVQDGAGTILLLFHPLGMAEQMDRSLSHRSAARSVTGMAAMLAHEIRNPLAGISGAAQLLSMSLSEDEQELTDLIRAETDRIGKLVERVEAFGDLRPTARHLPVARWWTPEEFAALREEGLRLGLAHVEADPLTRSSHHAKAAAASAGLTPVSIRT